jgi:SAM-dependent methyltransferase
MSDDELRAIFDEDAELCARARPDYPEELISDLGALASIGPGSRVVELGPGTGQATAALLGLGARVVAIELGAHLARTLERTLGSAGLETVVSSFEDWPLPHDPFDCVAAFTSWHWIDPDVRTAKVAAALRDGGALATVTTTHVAGGTQDFFDAAQSCYERWDPATPPGLRVQPAYAIPPANDEADESPLFTPATRLRYERDVTYTTEEYVALLSTYSGHRALPSASRAGLLACIRRLIDATHGGSVTKRYLYELRVARVRTHG